MQWKLSEEQDAYREAMRGWLVDLAPIATVHSWLAAGDQASLWSRFVADGWLGVGIPENAGGQGGGLVEIALTAEEFGRSGAPSSAWTATMLAVSSLSGSGRGISGDPAVRKVIADALGGEVPALLIPAEGVPDAVSPLLLDAAGLVSGAVPRVVAGELARHFLVPVGSNGTVELRLVDADDPGVVVLPRKLLDRSRSVADVTLAQVPSRKLVTDASPVLRRVCDLAAVLVAADALGASARMLELSVEYSKQRRQFGVPIASFQAVKHAAAGMLVAVEAARSVVYFAAASVQEGHPQAGLHAAAAKAQVTGDAAHCADTALTVHGAIGYTWEHELQIHYKRAKLDAVLYGSPSVWNERIASGLSLT